MIVDWTTDDELLSEIVDGLVKGIAEENEMLALIQDGWIKIELRWIPEIHISPSDEWIDQNIKGKVIHSYGKTIWLFELESDATMFLLRWG